MTQLAIKGHATRGKEIIEILEMLGGKNKIFSDGLKWFNGTNVDSYYTIEEDNYIHMRLGSRKGDYIKFTIEEFLEKFPYKTGYRVRVPEYESEVCISKMYWDGNEVQYEVVTDEVEWYSAEELNEFNEPNKEEIVEDIIKIDIPKGYEFASVDNQQVVFKKIKYHYPKNFKECCEVLGCKANDFFTNFSYDGCDVEISEHEDKVDDLLHNFRKLIYCRNAYWKLAGEEMGFIPWRPSKSDSVYCIFRFKGDIVKDNFVFGDSLILEFPTAEMRDAFYENFKELIEQCKELL